MQFTELRSTEDVRIVLTGAVKTKVRVILSISKLISYRILFEALALKTRREPHISEFLCKHLFLLSSNKFKVIVVGCGLCINF